MVWWKVDDKLHSNTKVRNVLADEPAALSLWTVAGSWSSDELTDGFIPDSQLPWLLPAGAEQLARKLVTARLWRRVRGGYQFHEWEADGDGTRRNPTRAEVEEERRKKAEAGRKGGLARAENQSKGQACATANAKASANGVLDPPTRPDHKSSTNSSTAAEPAGWAEFWTHYPRKEGKAAALKAYVKALASGATPEQLLAGAIRYRDSPTRNQTDVKFTKWPQGWLNERRWEDEDEPAPAPRRKFAWEN